MGSMIRIVALVGLFWALAPGASANVALPAVMAFGIPSWMVAFTMGWLLVVVVLVEAAVLWRLSSKSFREALELTFKINLISTALGFGLSVHPFEGFFIFGVALYLYNGMKHRMGWGTILPIAISVALVALFGYLQWPGSSIPALIAGFYAAMGLAFILTLFIEACMFAKSAAAREAWRWSLSINCASYLLLALLLWLGGFRSGAMAMTDHLTWTASVQKADSAEDRAAILSQLEEIYLWEKSGERSSLPMSRLFENSASSELEAVGRWVEEGFVEDAERLFALVSTYRDRPSSGSRWALEYWTDAEAALNEARAPSAFNPPRPSSWSTTTTAQAAN